MRRALPLLLLLSLVPGCAQVESYVESSAAKMSARDPNKPRPGLEPLYQPPADIRPGTIAPPDLPAASDLPFPPRLLSFDDAVAALAGDPAALRFLTIHRLAESGLIPPADADARAAANLGALLPLTAPQPPAAGLFVPTLAPDQAEKVIADLWYRPNTQGQRDFLVDNILPARPDKREPLVIADKDSAHRALARLDRLKDSGLITLEQKQAEQGAVQALLDGNTLPETLLPPVLPPVTPAPAPKPRKTGGSGTAKPMERLPGGVSGELKVITSPSELNAPPLPANFAGQAGIHLLSMGSASHGEMAWKALTTEFPDLSALTYKVVRVDLGELGVTHRLIAGPLSPAKANDLCAALKPKGQTCTPTPFPP